MQPNISVFILEDEPLWAKQLEVSLERIGFDIAGLYRTIDEALMALPKTHFDVALLDINVKGLNSGIELGKIIQSVYNKPIIFITASIDQETSADALTAHPSAYLVKPVNDTSLFVAIQQSLRAATQTPGTETLNDGEYFFVKTGARYTRIAWKDILCLFAEQKYVGIMLQNDHPIYYLRSSLQKFQQSLIPAAYKPDFVQISRSEIVNINCVFELSGSVIKTAKKDFEVSEGFLPELKKQLRILT
jgi:DNA-binding LytR/AlgR family response regulator